MDAVVSISSLMFQLTLLYLRRTVEHPQVLCKLVPIGATAAIRELLACLPKILLTMMHQYRDAQLKITLTLILTFISLSDFHKMNNKLKLSFINSEPVDLMSFLLQKSKKISEISSKVCGL